MGNVHVLKKIQPHRKKPDQTNRNFNQLHRAFSPFARARDEFIKLLVAKMAKMSRRSCFEKSQIAMAGSCIQILSPRPKRSGEPGPRTPWQRFVTQRHDEGSWVSAFAEMTAEKG
jgi:hypothetical protein